MSHSAYVTHCDKNYLSRVLALIQSLRVNGSSLEIYVFCHDQYAFDALNSLVLDNVKIRKIEALKSKFPELAEAENNRPPLEFYYSISPFLAKYILEEGFECSIYLDSDLYFYADPNKIIKNLGKFDVGITPHRFTPALQHLEEYGKFNVGLLFFRNNLRGREILNWWAAKCIESTSTTLTVERYADQKYLDQFINFEGSVFIFEDPGHNAAPWNCSTLEETHDEKYQVNGSKLIYYHFSGLRVFKRYAILGFTPYRHRPNVILRKMYLEYVSNLIRIESTLGNPNRFDYRKYKLIDLVFPFKYRDFLLIRRETV